MKGTGRLCAALGVVLLGSACPEGSSDGPAAHVPAPTGSQGSVPPAAAKDRGAPSSPGGHDGRARRPSKPIRAGGHAGQFRAGRGRDAHPTSRPAVPGPPESAYRPGPTWSAEGIDGQVRARFSPLRGAPQVGPLRTWVLELRDRADQPIDGARIGVNGGMPAHGHGLPTQPRVEPAPGPGRYRVEGVQFNMAGNWTVLFEIHTPSRRDLVQFAMRLEPARAPASHTDAGPTDEELRQLASLSLSNLGPPPAVPSNPVADDPRAAALGEKLFFDRRLSGDGTRSCASCHQPHRAFTDGRPKAVGAGPGQRNTPTILGAGWGRWFYWDGRRDSLWSQALIPFEAPDEMGGSRVAVLRRILEDPELSKTFRELFGTPKVDLAGLPEHAGPYGPDTRAKNAWHRLPVHQRRAIDRAYADVGRAIAAYERTLRFEPTPFDRHVDARVAGRTEDHLSPSELRGLELFVSDEARCLRCHNGPLFTNGGFHDIGTGSFEGPHLDFGRAFGLRAARMDPFNCLGPYSGAPADTCDGLRFVNPQAETHLRGAFKVPTLRLVSKTGPYFHDGRFETLEDVVRFYDSPDLRFDGVKQEPLNLTDEQVRDLVAFLKVL